MFLPLSNYAPLYFAVSDKILIKYMEICGWKITNCVSILWMELQGNFKLLKMSHQQTVDTYLQNIWKIWWLCHTLFPKIKKSQVEFSIAECIYTKTYLVYRFFPVNWTQMWKVNLVKWLQNISCFFSTLALLSPLHLTSVLSPDLLWPPFGEHKQWASAIRN